MIHDYESLWEYMMLQDTGMIPRDNKTKYIIDLRNRKKSANN